MSSPPTNIVMYARERFCPDVTRTRLRLLDLGLTWTEYDVETDTEARDAAIRVSGRSNVPTLVIGDQVLVEPSNAELERALVAAGFDISEDSRTSQ